MKNILNNTYMGFMSLILTAFLLLPLSASVQAAGASYFDAEPTLGSPDAPVTVVEYASMTCPHCATFHNKTFKAFKEKYIDSGKVKFIYREFPLDRIAFAAAKLARCSGEKRFFPMLDVLFSKQNSWASSSDPTGALRQMGKLAGVNSAAFDACMQDKDLSKLILKNRQVGQNQDNVSSTPSFVINGETFSGALSLEELDDKLSPLLK